MIDERNPKPGSEVQVLQWLPADLRDEGRVMDGEFWASFPGEVRFTTAQR
jgi:hypothetical protein